MGPREDIMMDQAGPPPLDAPDGPEPAQPAGRGGPAGPAGASGRGGPAGPGGRGGPAGPGGRGGAGGSAPAGPAGAAGASGRSGPAGPGGSAPAGPDSPARPAPAGPAGRGGPDSPARSAPGPDLAAALDRLARDPRAARQPPRPSRSDHPVVAGFDGSASSRNALAYAAGMARRIGQSLVVAYVTPGVFCEPMTGQVIVEQTAREETERWLLGELDQVCDRTGLDVSIVTRRGNPSRELAAVADAVCADALVIGAPGSLWHHIAGSVPGWLARHARCPVIVVP